MRKSVIDSYLDLIRVDAKYFSKYLQWMGTEVLILKPKKEVLENYEMAFGANASTFERTSANYDFIRGFISLDSLDFSKKENVADLDVLVYLPNINLDSGDMIQFEKLNKTFTYQVEPLESYQNFVYRTALRLVDVINLTSEPNTGLRSER